MKKLLILNGSHSEIPLIKAGKELGYYIITTGNRPDLIGHKYADEYVNCDFSDPELVYDVFKNREIDAICSCANDFGAITAAYLSEKLGLPGHDSYETALLLHHKDRFKKFAVKYNIPTPHAKSYKDVKYALSDKAIWQYPIMVKPVDLTGGKGVTKVDFQSEYVEAVNKAFNMSHVGTIVVEEFIEGSQHSFSTFLLNKKVIFYYSDNEYSDYNPFLVSTSGGPASDVKFVKETLIYEAEKIADILNLQDGVFHYQYIMSKDKKPHILEITRRCSGDMYSVPVQHAIGIPWAELIVRAECGMDCKEFQDNKKIQTIYGGRHCIMGEREGIVKDVYISDEIRNNIYDKFIWGGRGSVITNHLLDKIGILFLEYSSEEEMLDKCRRIQSLVRIEFE